MLLRAPQFNNISIAANAKLTSLIPLRAQTLKAHRSPRHIADAAIGVFDALGS
jgi:hypothetical protein